MMGLHGGESTVEVLNPVREKVRAVLMLSTTKISSTDLEVKDEKPEIDPS